MNTRVWPPGGASVHKYYKVPNISSIVAQSIHFNQKQF
uniref:Uncharacterized protein n=2 Tax=Anguilla anguilla TaxID=7936 RepID=A0A0E9XKW1_ANGAN